MLTQLGERRGRGRKTAGALGRSFVGSTVSKAGMDENIITKDFIFNDNIKSDSEKVVFAKVSF